ncbi:AMP-dependent synthetase/ligase, partial [Sesbania bispinosa]
MAEERFIVEVEKAKQATDGKPSMGPVYRSRFSKDPSPPPIDGLNTCWDVFRMSVEKYPSKPMLGRRETVNGNPGKYKWQTYKEVYDLVLKVGNSIRACGYGEGAKCGIYGANCAEWIMSMEACNAHGLYCVPLYDTLGAGAVEFIICHSEVSIAFVEEKKIPELLKTFPNATKYLKTLVSFGKVPPEQKQEIEKFGLTIYAWHEFLQVGNNQSFDLPVKKKTDICTIMYTSGTTGDPKGVLISNESIITILAAVTKVLGCCNEQLNEHDVYLSYLPLAHIFDRIIEEAMIWHGASIGFWRGDVKLLMEDIGELKPTIFVAVPRVLDRVYSVGPPVPYVDVCLESIPEMGYDALASTPRGEICVRGSTVFSGYHKREDLTKEVMVDGWFHTGDIGEWQPNGTMKIIDRKKNIFKLSQGEYVAVENLENIYVQTPIIESIWVYGNSYESYLVAVVNPRQQALEHWAEENAITKDFNSLCEDSRVKSYILGELARTGKEKKLKGFEFIKDVHLDPVPFDMERDLITPTYKKKRPQLLKYYQ